MHFCQLYRKLFYENMKKFHLQTEDLAKTPFFQRKCFWWRRCYGHVDAVPEVMPKNFEWKVRTGFAQSPKLLRKFFVWRIYFNPNCCFGQKNSKINGTSKNCPWGYGTIYSKVRNLLGLYTFFQNNISVILFRPWEKCTFDNAAAQLSP